jgi:hypothetical protein
MQLRNFVSIRNGIVKYLNETALGSDLTGWLVQQRKTNARIDDRAQMPCYGLAEFLVNRRRLDLGVPVVRLPAVRLQHAHIGHHHCALSRFVSNVLVLSRRLTSLKTPA